MCVCALHTHTCVQLYVGHRSLALSRFTEVASPMAHNVCSLKGPQTLKPLTKNASRSRQAGWWTDYICMCILYIYIYIYIYMYMCVCTERHTPAQKQIWNQTPLSIDLLEQRLKDEKLTKPKRSKSCKAHTSRSNTQKVCVENRLLSVATPIGNYTARPGGSNMLQSKHAKAHQHAHASL